MSAKSLLEPVIDNGIRNIHYFQGRLLSAEDLREQEEANRRHRQQLARIGGAGVVDGLEVSVQNSGASNTAPLVRINKGMAVNRQGDILELAVDYADVQLSRTLPSVDPDIVLFHDCPRLDTDTLVPAGAGFYVLVMSPVSQYRDFVPKSGLQSKGIAGDCGRRYVVEGVQFRLVRFDPASMPGISVVTRNRINNALLSSTATDGTGDPAALSMLRNLVAHVCFGSEAEVEAVAGPAGAGQGSVFDFDKLAGTGQGLDRCDVPLALIYWNLSGIAFIDTWSVRRFVCAAEDRHPAPAGLSHCLYERGLTLQLQFQEHLNFLEKRLNNLGAVKVGEYFQFLPPVGYLPLGSEKIANAFAPQVFFQGATVRNPGIIEGSRLEAVLRHGRHFRAIDLNRNELIWLYHVRENAQAAGGPDGESVKEYLLFVTGHAPYAANARFNVAKWDYSNYGVI